MDEELFTEETIKRLTEPEGAAPRNSEYYESLVVDIEAYTRQALALRTIVANAESNLDKARDALKAAKGLLDAARKDWSEAEAALDYATTNLQNHLNAVRGTRVTLRGVHHE